MHSQIIIQKNSLQNKTFWKKLFRDRHDIVVITDSRVKKIIAVEFCALLKLLNKHVLLLAFHPGEKYKTQATKTYLESQMLNKGIGRNALIIAVGGGVVGDVAGFVAATYMRGIAWIQVPTTLLAMVDSSVGGKTGINTPQGKNLIGAFWQPMVTVIDITLLKALSKRHCVNGLIEIIKIFLILDVHAFDALIKEIEQFWNVEGALLSRFISHAIKLKLNIVACDERDILGYRALLNFGHTIGHALERVSDYEMLHGEAVAYGMLVEAKISQLLGFLSEKHFLLIQQVLAKLHFHGRDLLPFSAKKIVCATYGDKKNKDGKVHYVLLKQIGVCVKKRNVWLHEVPDVIVYQAIESLVEQ